MYDKDCGLFSRHAVDSLRTESGVSHSEPSEICCCSARTCIASVSRHSPSYELRVTSRGAVSRHGCKRDTYRRHKSTSPQVHYSTTAAHPVETEGCTILGLCAPSVRQQLASVLPCQRCSGVTCFGAVSCVREDGRRCRPAVQ